MLIKPFLAANWKMNKNPFETAEYFDAFLKEVPKEQTVHFSFFPPVIDLPVTSEKLKDTSCFWGAQNIYIELNGAFTGETSASAVKSLGASMCLVGHSERRSLFNEDDEQVASKVKILQEQNLVPMICLGESLVQRKSNKTFDILEDQLNKALKYIDKHKSFVIAYEPVWAIGTGQVATPEMAEEAHVFLRKKLQDILDEKKATETLLLYGGSVKPDNAKELYQQENIDGFLVGGASLHVESFLKIYHSMF